MQERRKRAFARWRAGSHQLHYFRTPDRRLPYDQAVAQALAYLQRYSTMDELLRAYLDVTPDGKTWLVAACTVEGGRRLSAPVVEDAAFWRRTQQLIAALAQGRPS